MDFRAKSILNIIYILNYLQRYKSQSFSQSNLYCDVCAYDYFRVSVMRERDEGARNQESIAPA